MDIGRRQFLKKASGSLAIGLSVSHQIIRPISAAAQAVSASSGKIHQSETREGDMVYRRLGRTAEKVSLIGLGGYHIGKPSLSDEDSLRIIRSAIDRGITYMDDCWDYNGGHSEIRMGKALRNGYREKVFLMTKIDGRTKRETERQIDESLKRLQTDYIDLLQHHEVIRMDDPDRIFAESGTGIDSAQVLDQALEAARTYKPLTKEEIAVLLTRTREAALGGKFELYKISNHFDGTVHNPQWLG
jgi:hypothetical protein